MALLLLHLLHHSNIQISLCFALFLLFLYLIQKFRTTQKPKLKLPPSPPKLPLIGHLHMLGDLPYRSLKELSDKHGPLMFLQLGQIPTLVVSSAEAAREVLKTHDLAFADRFIPIAAEKLSYGCSDVTFSPYGEYWRRVRKICILELLSAKRVQSYRTVREEEMGHMIDNISRSCNRSNVIDLSLVLQSLANNILCRVAFGKSYSDGSEMTGKSKFIELIEESVALMGGITLGDFFPSIVWVSMLTGLRSRLKKNFQDLDCFLEQIIKDHLDPVRPKLDHEDIVDVLLQVGKGSALEVSLTRDHIKALLMDMYVAGSDTSSVTLEWAMTELVRHPRVMKKAQREVREIVEMKGKIEETDVGKLEYLKLVLKEVLRLHPPGPFLLPRVCREECKINGYDIPKKARVFINVWAIGRDPKYWKDPENFWPERFVDSSIDFRGHDFEFLPFGAGRRGCPGIHFATATIELALAHLLQSFDWELPPGLSVEELDMNESFSPVIRKKFALHLVATPHPATSAI